MEKKDIVFLDEIKYELEELKNRIRDLESKIQVLENNEEDNDELYPEDITDTATEEVQNAVTEEVPITTNEEVQNAVTEKVSIAVTEEVPITANEEVQNAANEEVQNTITEEVPITANAEVQNAVTEEDIVPTAGSQEIMIDALAERQAWRKDMPGSPVEDIRKAISINDRILFINSLFYGNTELFQDTIRAINTMTNLNDVIEMIDKMFPDWDMDSETVYRFMMIARRRVK